MRGVLAGAFFGAEAFLPLMLVQQRGVSATQAGLSLTGGALGWALGSWYQGRPRLPLPRHRLIQAGAGFVTVGIVSALLVLIPAVPAAIAIPAWAVGAFGMGLGMSSISVLLFEYSAVEDQGANSAAVQLADALGSIGCIGLGGVIFAFAHARAADVIAFLVIFAAMATLAALGAMLAGRAGRPHPQVRS
jgi:MFS family permease